VAPGSEKTTPIAHGIHIGRPTVEAKDVSRGKGVPDDDDHLTLAEHKRREAKQKKKEARTAVETLEGVGGASEKTSAERSGGAPEEPPVMPAPPSRKRQRPTVTPSFCRSSL